MAEVKRGRGRPKQNGTQRVTKGVSFRPEILEGLDQKIKDMNKQRGVRGLTRSQVIDALIEDFIKE